LATISAPQNQLYFHKENFDALGERQMWASAPEDNIGEIIDFNSTDAVFYTNTDGNVTVNIPDGNWNTILRYISSPMPASLMHSGVSSENMSYHFENDLDSPLDTTTNTVMTLGTGSNRPIWNATGHQGAGAYAFSGNQFASIAVTGDNNLNTSPATTSGWFYGYSSGPASDQTIYYAESSSGTDSYKIYLNPTGHLIYELDAGSTSQIATCTSAVNYKDNSWHHFAALMPGENDCELYVDGNLEDTDSNGGNGSINLSDDIFVGASDGSGTDGFNGMLDDIIHWDDYTLDESIEQEISDLFNTNYGVNGHFLNFDLRIVDEFGGDLGLSNKTITQTLNYPIKYSSDFGEYATPISDIWGELNFTAITTEERVINPGERLMINMTYTPKVIGNLNMKLAIDDTDIVSGSGSSFLQPPLPDVGLPGYATYDNSGPGTIGIFNPGPKDTWIKYQSRVIFKDEITGAPYAAFITTVNGTAIGPTQDSPPMYVDQTMVVEFDIPREQPGNISSPLIPEGRYGMYIFLDGFDAEGQVFLQTSLIGVVRVT